MNQTHQWLATFTNCGLEQLGINLTWAGGFQQQGALPAPAQRPSSWELNMFCHCFSSLPLATSWKLSPHHSLGKQGRWQEGCKEKWWQVYEARMISTVKN